jgi:hypothetical protein
MPELSNRFKGFYYPHVDHLSYGVVSGLNLSTACM